MALVLFSDRHSISHYSYKNKMADILNIKKYNIVLSTLFSLLEPDKLYQKRYLKQNNT